MSDMPVVVPPAPDVLDRSPVLLSSPLPVRMDEAPGHAVVCDRGIAALTPFETWLARTPDGGRSWRFTPRGAYATLVEAQADLLTLAA